MTLPLYGTASQSAGFCSDKARTIIRLRSVDSTAVRCLADFAVAKTSDEARRAMKADWPSILVVSDGSIDLSGTFKGRLVEVSEKYNYLADGDVMGSTICRGNFVHSIVGIQRITRFLSQNGATITA